MNVRKIAIATVALAGVLVAATVEARGRDDVQFSLTIGSPFAAVPVPVHGGAFFVPPHHRLHGG
ncbi:MAG: hypothetical protein ACXWUL_02240, partial [Caldimonas sp.]